jgi:hypothetical protein
VVFDQKDAFNVSVGIRHISATSEDELYFAITLIVGALLTATAKSRGISVRRRGKTERRFLAVFDQMSPRTASSAAVFCQDIASASAIDLRKQRADESGKRKESNYGWRTRHGVRHYASAPARVIG